MFETKDEHTGNYRVINRAACFWLRVKNGVIIDAAPIANRWIGTLLTVFQRQHRAEIKKMEYEG